MVDEIFSHVEKLPDLLCFSMTCQALWEIGRKHIYRHVAALAANCSWAGDRIMCIGDYLDNKDIPETLFTPAEREEFSLDSLYEYPFQIAKQNLDLDLLWINSEISKRFGGFRLADRSRDLGVIRHLCNDGHDMQPPIKSGNRILRNISRFQYVRESALLELTARYPGVGFGEVILSRICLSSDPSTNMASEGLSQGVWAGDRFDFVATEWLQELGDDAHWTDVSEEVVEEMEEICEVDCHHY